MWAEVVAPSPANEASKPGPVVTAFRAKVEEATSRTKSLGFLDYRRVSLLGTRAHRCRVCPGGPLASAREQIDQWRSRQGAHLRRSRFGTKSGLANLEPSLSNDSDEIERLSGHTLGDGHQSRIGSATARPRWSCERAAGMRQRRVRRSRPRCGRVRLTCGRIQPICSRGQPRFGRTQPRVGRRAVGTSPDAVEICQRMVDICPIAVEVRPMLVEVCPSIMSKSCRAWSKSACI